MYKVIQKELNTLKNVSLSSGVLRWVVWGGFKPPPPEIPKTLQNRAKLNSIVKTVKNCWI